MLMMIKRWEGELFYPKVFLTIFPEGWLEMQILNEIKWRLSVLRLKQQSVMEMMMISLVEEDDWMKWGDFQWLNAKFA